MKNKIKKYEIMEFCGLPDGNGITLMLDGKDDGLIEKDVRHPKGMTFDEWLHDQWADYLSWYDGEKLPLNLEQFIDENCLFSQGDPWIDPFGIYAEECTGGTFYSDSVYGKCNWKYGANFGEILI